MIKYYHKTENDVVKLSFIVEQQKKLNQALIGYLDRNFVAGNIITKKQEDKKNEIIEKLVGITKFMD